MMHRRNKTRLYKWLGWSLGPFAAAALILSLIDIDDVVMAQGIVEPGAKIYIDSPLSRVVDRVLVGPGDTVRTGQVLAQLYDGDLKSSVTTAEKDLKGAEANLAVTKARLARLREQPTPEELRIAESLLEQAKISLEARDQDLKRARHLYLGERLWSQEELERAQTNYELAQANLKVAIENFNLTRRGPSNAELDQAAAEVRQAQATLEGTRQDLVATREALALTTLKAPADGIVVRRDLHPGMLAGPGGIVLIVAGLGRETIIDAWIGETSSWKVRVGNPVEILSNMFSDREDFAGLGRVSTIHGYALNDGGARTFQIRVDIEETPIPLRYGSTADLRIVVGQRSILKILLGFENRSAVEAGRAPNTPARQPDIPSEPVVDQTPTSDPKVVQTDSDSIQSPPIQ